MKPGDRVVYVDNKNYDFRVLRDFKTMPILDKIYTVRENREKDGGILLEEIVNPIINFPELMMMLEPGFAKRRFKLVKDQGLLSKVNSLMKEVEKEQLVEI